MDVYGFEIFWMFWAIFFAEVLIVFSCFYSKPRALFFEEAFHGFLAGHEFGPHVIVSWQGFTQQLHHSTIVEIGIIKLNLDLFSMYDKCDRCI
jgi:hypothetical protein